MKLLVISSYPEKFLTHGQKTVGGASYTKNLVTNLKKSDKNINIEVLAEVFDKQEIYFEDDVKVNRIWKRSSFLSLIQLMIYVLKNPTEKLLISFEFYMFGGLFQNILFLIMLFFWKVSGKKNIIIFHQVVNNLKILYRPFIFLSEKIIVFEEKFRNILVNKKVVFIPHAVEQAEIINKPKNEEFNSLYFGYISPYKGVDYLIDFWKKEYGLLTIAGWANPNHMKNKKYSKTYRNLLKMAEKKGIKTTGFVPENNIGDYFSKSDLVILPYKNFFSSSGPLSLAFSYEKPIILSKSLVGYFESPDFKRALNETDLRKEDFIFDFDQNSFINRINWAKKNLYKLANFSRIMKEKRTWKKIVKQYEKLLKQI